MKKFPYHQIGVFIGVMALLALAPCILTTIQIRMLNEIAYFALFAVSYNLLFNYAGLLSFGHAAYFGLGGYTVALSLKYIAGMPILLSIALGGVVGAIGGAIIGFFCVQRSGPYFSLLTLAFNQFLWAIVWKWRDVTSGEDGIGIHKTPINIGIITLDPTKVEVIYYLTITIVLFCLALAWFLIKTPFGNTVWTVMVNEERADFLGYDVTLEKRLIFTISAFFAGVAGSLFALFQEFVAPSSIDMAMSFQVVLMAFLGGTGSFFGPVLGAAIYIYFTDWVSSITDRWEFFLGVLFIVLVLYFHRGFIGLIPKRVKALFGVENPF